MTVLRKRLVRALCRKIACVFLLLFIVYFFLNTLYIDEDLTNLPADISCHYLEKDDVLSPVDDYYSPSPNSIFFHETSCKGYLTSRELCAIESAALAHPDFEIHVLFSSPITKKDFSNPTFKLLDLLLNVRYARVHIIKYAKDTPLEELVKVGALHQSQWRVHHTSDVLRLITLYKWGGVYLDLDFVVAKALDTLGNNWVARESDIELANSALAFSVDEFGRNVATEMAREIQTTFDGHSWTHNGNGVITRVLKKICETTNVTLMSAVSCGGMEVYGPEFFYPIKWQHGEEYFKPGKLKNKNAYLYHIWNHLTRHYKVHRDSPYAQLAKQYCPSTYEFYGDEFGM